MIYVRLPALFIRALPDLEKRHKIQVVGTNNFEQYPSNLRGHLFSCQIIDFRWSLGRIEYSWTWRSCFRYEIQWKTNVFQRTSKTAYDLHENKWRRCHHNCVCQKAENRQEQNHQSRKRPRASLRKSTHTHTRCSETKPSNTAETTYHQTGDGKHFASNFWDMFWTRFSRILVIICISGGYQDLLLGLYQVFTLIYLGISKLQKETPTRNWVEKIRKIYENPITHPFIPFLTVCLLAFFCRLPELAACRHKR